MTISMEQITAEVAIIVGSESDLEVIRESKILEALDTLGVIHALSVCSAHRNNAVLHDYLFACSISRTDIFIAAAGKAAALPGDIASCLANAAIVYGVPLISTPFGAIDSTLAMLSLPKGVLVRTTGVGKDGLYNAGLEAAKDLALRKKATGDEQAWEVWNEFKISEDAKKPAQFNIELNEGE